MSEGPMSGQITEPARNTHGTAAETPVQMVLDAARRFIAYRERAAALVTGRLHPPMSLAEAIDRDFLAFDITQAERALRAAVIALDPDSAPVWLAEPEARARHAAPG